MGAILGIVATVLVLLYVGVVLGKDSSAEDSGEAVTPPPYFKYKVKALNTALYFILQSLLDDLQAGEEVDISFLTRIKIVIAKINAFEGEVDETNLLMLGELRESFPDGLKTKMRQEGIAFDEYTAPNSTALPTASDSAESSPIIHSEII